MWGGFPPYLRGLDKTLWLLPLTLCRHAIPGGNVYERNHVRLTAAVETGASPDTCQAPKLCPSNASKLHHALLQGLHATIGAIRFSLS